MRTALLIGLLALPGCVDDCVDLDWPEPTCPRGPCDGPYPYGLTFTGAAVGDGGASHPTAAGGRQTYHITDGRTGNPLSVPISVSAEGESIAIRDVEGDDVTVDGVAPGSGDLIVRNISDVLMDRATVSVATIETIELRPVERRRDADRPWEAWTGATIDVVIALADTNGERVVDEAMDIDHADGVEVVDWPAWDTLRVIAATGDLAQVRAGDRDPVTISLATSQQIDAVEVVPSSDSEPHVGTYRRWCFETRHGDADLLFVPWTFTLEGPAHWFGEPAGNCASVAFDEVGRVDVTAAAPGIEPVTVSAEVVR
jgi:hypothetical protein